MRLAPVPVRDAALRERRAVQQRVRDRPQTFASGGLQQPSHIGAREVAERGEAERDVLDHEALIALGAGHLELVTGDLLHGRRLNLRQSDGDAQDGHAEDALHFDSLVGIRGDEDQLFGRFPGGSSHGADSIATIPRGRRGWNV